MLDTKKLFAVFADHEHEYRVVLPEERLESEPGYENAALILYYIKPTALMRRLDDVFGVGRWSTQVKDVTGPGGKQAIAVSLIVPVPIPQGADPLGSRTMDVVHTSVGTGHKNLNSGAIGAFDGALARAASHLGVGRYLWDLPPVYIDLAEDGSLVDHPLDVLVSELGQLAVG